MGDRRRGLLHTFSMRPHACSTAPRSSRGFTLIELMIAVVVIAILAGLAFPSYMNSLRKGRRAEAFAALAAVQQAQERWRANKPGYASDLTSASPTGLGLQSTTGGGLYGISIVTDSSTISTTYEAVATAASGKSQENDGNCAKLGVKMEGGNLTYGGTTVSGTLSYTSTNPCWSR